MIKKLKDMIKKKQGSRFNINIGLRGIQAKQAAERSGLAQPGAIASFGGVNDVDKPMLKRKLAELEQEGFGDEPLPGEELRNMIMKKLRRERKKGKKKGKKKKRKAKRPKGSPEPSSTKHMEVPLDKPANNKPLARHMTKAVSKKVMPLLLKSIIKARTVHQKGLGPKDGPTKVNKKMTGAMKSKLFMAILKGLNDGASRSRVLSSKGYKLSGAGLRTRMNKQQLKALSKNTAAGLMPLLMNMMGCGSFADLKKRTENPTLLDKLSRKLFEIFAKKMKRLLTPKKNLQVGSGFFKDFARGFMSVVRPALSVVKTVAPLLPLVL
jgi:hypothetical protein